MIEEQPDRQTRIGCGTIWVFVLLAALLATDVALMCAHVAWAEENRVWDIESSIGFGERFQYLKWAAAGLLLLALAWRRRALIYAVWAALFFYLLIDDSQSVHERTGSWLVRLLDLTSFEDWYYRHFEYFFLQAQDFGELIFAAALGIVIAVVIWFCWPGPEAARERKVTKWLLAWVVLFAVFAVGVDMLHVMAWEIYPPAIDLLLIVEDGGEMICASLLVAGLVLEVTRSGTAPITCLRRLHS